MKYLSNGERNILWSRLFILHPNGVKNFILRNVTLSQNVGPPSVFLIKGADKDWVKRWIGSSVSDPYSFDPDPDQAILI